MNQFMKNVASHTVATALGVALATYAAAAVFSITRIALNFDDHKPATIVERDSKLAAQAEVSFTGSGLLRATWEVAGPSADGNNPSFRVLANVQQPLAGRDVTVIKTPHLPTDSTGAYLLRLRIIEPASPLDVPVIRYNVNEKNSQ